MKRYLTLILPLILLLVAILTFGVGGGIASAARMPQRASTSAAKASPAVARTSCVNNGDNVTFALVSDYGADFDCFSGTGSLSVAIYNVNTVATGNATGYLRWEDSAGGSHQWNFPHANTDYYPSGVTYLPLVYLIVLS